MTAPTPSPGPAPPTPAPTEALRERLGLEQGADDAAVLAAVDRVLAARPAGASPEAVHLDRAAYDELVAAADAGRTVQAREARQHRERLVDAAVRDGRIAPARRAAWASVLERTPDAVADLERLPPGMAVPLEAKGHDTGAHAARDPEGWFAGSEGRRTG